MARAKSLIMETLPMTAGSPANIDSLRHAFFYDCKTIGYNVTSDDFNEALAQLSDEQCLVVFQAVSQVRPTQYGINKYCSFD